MKKLITDFIEFADKGSDLIYKIEGCPLEREAEYVYEQSLLEGH